MRDDLVFRRFFLIFRILLLTLLIMATFACASRSNLVEGINSFKVQNYREAFIRLKPEAERGHPDAQYAIGYMYYYGQGVIENRKKALVWIKCAADAGQPQAREALKILIN